MAHHKSAIKRIRTNQKANQRNRQYRSLMKTSIRRVMENSDPVRLQDDLKHACAVLDRLTGKGMLHRNTAARRKSYLHRFVARRLSAPTS